jgi:protein gp37
MPTKIGWTGETWNPTTGCDRISPGCDNCYALTMAGRLKLMGQAKYQNDGDPRTSGPGFRLTVHPDTLDTPLHWRKPRFVFANSMSDLFHADVPDAFIVKVFAVMSLTPRHTYQVLTKRPQRMAELVGRSTFRRSVEVARYGFHQYAPRLDEGAWPLPNVWLGTSIESDRYTFRTKHLAATPNAVPWVSAEPLLSELPSLDLTGIGWVVVGGESGPGHREMDVGWLLEVVARCDFAGVPVFVKQDSGRYGEQQGRIPNSVWARKEFPV